MTDTELLDALDRLIYGEGSAGPSVTLAYMPDGCLAYAEHGPRQESSRYGRTYGLCPGKLRETLRRLLSEDRSEAEQPRKVGAKQC